MSPSTTTPASTATPATHQIVYTIVERPRDRRKVWVRIGAAFRNHDGSTNVYLDAMPTNGQLQIREPRASELPNTDTPAPDTGGRGETPTKAPRGAAARTVAIGRAA